MKVLSILLVVLGTISCSTDYSTSHHESIQVSAANEIQAVNKDEILAGDQIVAIKDVNLIDGLGGAPLPNTTVIIKNTRITSITSDSEVSLPEGAMVYDGKGLSLLPGFIDAHFHLDGNHEFPTLFLRNGVTSVRDPGAWIESYSAPRASGEELPRLFLTGPHLDMPPPAYPRNSYIVRDPIEARYAVNKFADQGASAIKVYFRLPVSVIESICTTADSRGIPVVAHLEITGSMAAIDAGVDGIEHITSFGTDLLPTYEAEQYEQSVLADNNARRVGRYEVWESIDLEHARTDSLLLFLKSRGTVVSPTLGAFEHQFSTDTLSKIQAFRLSKRYVGNDALDSVKVRAFQNMLEFTGMVHQAGIVVVVGSHSWVPYAKVGWAFHHEMELLSQCGLSNMDIIQAATIENARYLRIDHRLGSIEVGKQADLLLLEEDPTKDLSALYKVNKVMLNGKWVGEH